MVGVMARPREFDETEVLDRALSAFWSKGYDGTSMEDLVQETGLGRASLYGAFGDKEQLFRRVLDHYIEKVRETEVEPPPDTPPEKALAMLTHRWVLGSCPKEGPKGCFLSVACATGSVAASLRETVERAAQVREKLLVKVIARGQASGAFHSSSSPESLAQFLMIMQQGIATAARSGLPQKELSHAMKEALAHVVGRAVV